MGAATKALQSSSTPVATTGSGESAAVSTSTDRMTAAAAQAAPVKGPAELGVAGIRRRAAGLATETPFETLGLVEGASAEAARAAYFRLGRLWHPDRLPRDLEEARADVERIYQHMTETHAVLTNPQARPALVTRNGR
jgi:hypothetical protein